MGLNEMIGSKYLARVWGTWQVLTKLWSSTLFHFSEFQVDNEFFLNLFLSAKMFNVILVERNE